MLDEEKDYIRALIRFIHISTIIAAKDIVANQELSPSLLFDNLTSSSRYFESYGDLVNSFIKCS